MAPRLSGLRPVPCWSRVLSGLSDGDDSLASDAGSFCRADLCRVRGHPRIVRVLDVQREQAARMKQSQKAFFEKYQKEIEEAEREEVYQDAKNPFPENSFVAPMKSEPIRPGARGSPTKESISPERADDGAGLPRPRPTTPVRPSNLGSVPTSLEKIFSGTSDERNVHEVLGVLVEAHIREAESILGRTFLKS